MGDIMDLSSIASSGVRMIDFRIFASTWCKLNMERACFGDLCCSLTGTRALGDNIDQCRSLLSGLEVSSNCVYPVEEDCRTTVWTYNQNSNNVLDSFQPEMELKKKKKISYVRKRKDLYKTLGPGSKAETSAILAFGSLFTGPYKGSELYIDIHDTPGDPRIQSLLKGIEFIPFAPEIIAAGKEFALSNIKKPFLCTQLRLLDGQFKNHWKSTFSALKQKLDSLKLDLKTEKVANPIHIFLMTDLPTSNWTGTYLEELAKDAVSYKLHYLQESSDIVVQTARRLMEAEHGVRSGFLPKNIDEPTNKKDCRSAQLPDILLHIEESVCSCASLGFVGTAGSTIAENIELMRKNDICKL